MTKFERIYELKVEVAPGSAFGSPLRNPNQINANVTIQLPYACDFTISRQTLSSAQTATFRVKNLAPDVRDAIQKDLFDAGQLRAVQFRAGYANATGFRLPLIFNGTVNFAFSKRDGRDWITEIQAFDGGYSMVNGITAGFTQGPGLSRAEAIYLLAKSMPALIGLPIVGDFPETNKRAEVYFGNTWDIIQKKSNGLAIIDNGQVKALNFHEVIKGALPEINDSSGVIGLPAIALTTVDFDMVFEPNLTIGQIIQLNLTSTPKLNRAWKVLGFEHRGTITNVGPAGEAVTSVKLWYTKKDLTLVEGLPILI